MSRAEITFFSDPMMGLAWECCPTLERLDKELGVSIRHAMVVLVRDIADFMLPGESLAAYNARLAGIYESESSIGGLPIVMPHLKLFDEGHRTSEPLCRAVKAAQLAAPDKADAFLHRLREATIVEVRPTTHRDEILRVARLSCIDETEFKRRFDNGDAKAALAADERLAMRHGVRSLPCCLIGGSLVNPLLGYECLAAAIQKEHLE